MENTLDTFKTQQAHSVALLGKLQHFLKHGAEAGVAIDPTLNDKLQQAIDSVAGEKLRVALIGGFSEGKTSIAAAWMERLDKSSMKISHQESSNEVKVYEVGEDFVLVDTPGLFGFKEQENIENHAVEKYKDITRKHVSEAHLVLYVMNPTNPVKESHKEELLWLFRTLDLLPRTVFVLSRFDEVADVEDMEDYQRNLGIKRSNVVDRLRELISLGRQEVDELAVVAVAANPFDLGVEHWLSNLEQFKELSHIATLQAATVAKIRANGGSGALIGEMRTSVIRDVLSNQLPVAIEIDQKVSQEVAKLSEINVIQTAKLQAIGEQIEDARIALREFAIRYFSDLIMQVRGCSIETFSDFFEREIGEGGVIVATELQNQFSRQTQSINLEIQKIQIGFDAEVNHFNSVVKSFGKQGINYLTKSNVISNTTVLAARDGIVSVAKTVGLDVGKYLKFKPWGAVKFAKGATGALVVVGFALEAWDSWDKYKREKAFQQTIKDLVDNFEKQRQDFLDLVNSEQFKEQFFGDYLVLKTHVAHLQEDLEKNIQRQQRFQDWRDAAEAIEAEFRVLEA